MPQAKVISTAGVVLHLNGKPFGRVRAFQWSINTPKKPINAIDSLQPFEFLPTASQVSGHLSIYRTVGDAGVEGAAMAARMEDIPREKYFSIQLVERGSDTIVFQAMYCSLVRQSWSAQEKGLVTGEIDFQALDWSNELRTR